MSDTKTEAAIMMLEALHAEAGEIRDTYEHDDVHHEAARVLRLACDRAMMRLRSAPPAAEPACVHCGHARHPRWCEADECSCATGYEFDPPAEPATDAEPVEPVAKVARVSTGEVIWHPAGVPLTVGMHLYSAAQLAAAESRGYERGRKDAEARIAKVEEALRVQRLLNGRLDAGTVVGRAVAWLRHDAETHGYCLSEEGDATAFPVFDAQTLAANSASAEKRVERLCVLLTRRDGRIAALRDALEGAREAATSGYPRADVTDIVERAIAADDAERAKEAGE